MKALKMKTSIPLTFRNSHSGVEIYRNKNRIFAPHPFHPFFYSNNPIEFLEANAMSDRVSVSTEDKVLLSTKEKTKIFKYEFIGPAKFVDYNTTVALLGKSIIKHSYANWIYAKEPDFFTRYPNTENLTIYLFDIECLTTGTNRMVTADRDSILSIGVVAMHKGQFVRKMYSTYAMSEKEMLEKWKADFINFDPDIISGYNIKRFDLPYLIERMRLLNVDESFLHRDFKPHHLTNLVEIKEKLSSFSINKNHDDIPLRFHGRVVYDLYIQCSKDNKLRKIRNLKLDTVAKYFSIPNVSLPKGVIADLRKFLKKKSNWKIVLDYMNNDVDQSFEIFKIYFTGKVLLAEVLGVPLENILNDYPSFIPNIIMSREMWSRGFLGDLPNREKYPEITTYQGASVNLWKKGLFSPVYHIDFSAMYPSIMISYNLSPETTSLLKMEPWNEKFETRDFDDHIIYYLPDEKLNKRLVIKVMKKDGVIRKLLLDLMEQRMKYKNMYRDSRRTDEKLNSLQNIYKLAMNITYGYNGSSFCYWGDLIVGIATTGIGRELINRLADEIVESRIECDTDGIWMSDKPDLKYLNDKLKDIVSNEHFTTLFNMSLDYETEDAGYFYKMKSYIVKQQNGNLFFVGSNFINRRFPIFIQHSYEKLITLIFNGDEKKICKFLDNLASAQPSKSVSRYSMTSRLTKDAKDYKSKNSVHQQLLAQIKEHHIGLEYGAHVQYVKCKTAPRYRLLDLEPSLEEIDVGYYLALVRNMIDKLDLWTIPYVKNEIGPRIERLIVSPHSTSLNDFCEVST